MPLGSESLRGILATVKRERGLTGPIERRAIVMVALTLAGVSFVLSILLSGEFAERIAKAVSAGSAFVALLFAYLQWRVGRLEASFENYYSRLDIANRRFDLARLAQITGEPQTVQDHHYTMLVFAELDNLEYVIGKYQQGYISDELACRALRHFVARCQDEAGEQFRGASRHWANRAGYRPPVQELVARLAGA